jgi:hypothetical protein
MISYDRYTELLSKCINRTIMDSEQNDITKFEAAQPKTCPQCHAAVWSSFQPPRALHDAEKCAGKLTGGA